MDVRARLQVGSGVAIDLGAANCLNTIEFVQGKGSGLVKRGDAASGGAAGGLNVAGELRLGRSS